MMYYSLDYLVSQYKNEWIMTCCCVRIELGRPLTYENKRVEVNTKI